MNIFALNDLREQAEHAAEQNIGPQACPYPDGSAPAAEWLRIYYAHVQELAMRCAA